MEISRDNRSFIVRGGNQLKKVLAIVSLLIAFFAVYFLQANFFSWFTIAGIKPNLFIIFILFIGLFAGKKIGIFLGLILGLVLDLLVGRTVGMSGILLAIIGFLGEYFDKNFSKESRFTIMLMIIGSTFLYEIGSYIFYLVRLGISFEPYSFAKILLIEALYNALIAIILYPLIQKTGYALENTFKVKNVLTRYF